LLWLWTQAVSTAATLPPSCCAAADKICRASGGRHVFGIVGVSNVAKSTKEFKLAQSFHLFGRFGAANGVDGTKECATDTRTDDRG
jgi:hypothetical protein